MKAITTLLLTAASCAVFGQKLPAVQEGGMAAPKNVHVDAKLNEWDEIFKAYNKATQLYYSIANDQDYLYLVIKSTDQANITKITSGGIMLTINIADKKNDKDAFGIAFPVVDKAAAKALFEQKGQNGPPKPAEINSREIKVLGFKNLPDSLISIYNEYGIKAAMAYDQNNNLVYELGLPLKLLGLTADQPKEFAYHIKLNGVEFGDHNSDDHGGGGNGGRGGGNGSGGGSKGGGGGNGGGDEHHGMDKQTLMSPTDFWAKYTLINK